jgi:hypothetical protein
MSAKFLPVIVAGSLLGTTALASAQPLVYPQYGYNYSYYGYAPAYPPAVTFGYGVGPGAITHRDCITMLPSTSHQVTAAGTKPGGTIGSGNHLLSSTNSRAFKRGCYFCLT